jgi:hypothetical protein
VYWRCILNGSERENEREKKEKDKIITFDKSFDKSSNRLEQFKQQS